MRDLHSFVPLARGCAGHGLPRGSRSLGLPPAHGWLSTPWVRLVRRSLLARCAAQSCKKQGGLLSLSIAQRGCWCSRAAVRWREGLIGGVILLHQRAQHAPSPGDETCWWATGASFSVLSLALCSMSQYSCCADRRAGRVVPRVEREARGARLSVNPAAHARRQGCSTGDWHCGDAVAVTPTLLCRSKAPVLCFLAAEI